MADQTSSRKQQKPLPYPPPLGPEELRRRVLLELRRAGFRRRKGLIAPRAESKEDLRRLHLEKRRAVLKDNARFIRTWESHLLNWFAEGEEVDPTRIEPVVMPVKNEEQAALFRFATLHWSVPVSQGYGRRTRFLLMDKHNARIIGIFALGDPVYNLKARDDFIGWNADDRRERLYNVFDAFVMGAVPPYRELIAGKLVAMAAISSQTIDILTAKYEGQVTHIESKIKQPRPVLVTTTSALGRSSIYNRLKVGDRVLYQPIGFTKGYGHFQISDGLFKSLRAHLEANARVPGNAYGHGPNWKIRTLREALSSIGLKPDLLKHNIKRQVFVAPLAERWKEYLRGETQSPGWDTYALADFARFWRVRWAVPRAERDDSYLHFNRSSMRLTPQLDSRW